MMYGSVSFDSGSGCNLPSIIFKRWWVTTADSFANPSTCCASLLKKSIGINNGKFAFCTPCVLMRLSISSRISSQIAQPYGLIVIQPRTGAFSAKSAATIKF